MSRMFSSSSSSSSSKSKPSPLPLHLIRDAGSSTSIPPPQYSPSLMKPLLNGETTVSSSSSSSRKGFFSFSSSASTSSSWLTAPSKREWVLILCSIATGLIYLHASRGWFNRSNPVMSWDVDHGLTLGKGEGHRWHEGIGPLELEREKVIEEESFEYEDIGKNGVYAETQLVQHAPGWTIFKNLYQHNSTFLILTSRPSDFPSIRQITSSGAPMGNTPDEIAAREPTDQDMRTISPIQARELFGWDQDAAVEGGESDKFGQPIRQSGGTWIVNDPSQFITHYYHFAAELLFGLWRTYTSLDTGITEFGRTSHLTMPRRIIFTHTDVEHWRDYSGMNALIMKSVFPRTKLEFAADFLADRTSHWLPALNRYSIDRPFIYDQVVFADRAAASRGPMYAATNRDAAEAFLLPSSPHWWSPVRRSLLSYVGVPDSDLLPGPRPVPVVTYVSRQNWGRRMLKANDHARLVKALEEACAQEGWELNIVDMSKLDNHQQVRLAARSTIMMGVHGNGLTHLLWMKPTPRSTVIEFFYPGGFAYDYEFTARGLGIQHFAMWDAQTFTAPDQPPIAYPEGFQGNEIPINAEAVVALVKARLFSDEEADDG